MKIAYYTDQLYKFGGIERVLAHKINYLTNTSTYEIHLITTEQGSRPPFYELDPRVIHIDLGINYDRSKSYLHSKNILKIPKHISRLKSVLKRLQPDIMVICNHGIDFYFIPFIWRKTIKIKEFHSSRHYDFYNRKISKSLIHRIRWSLADYIELKFNQIVVLTEDEQKYYKAQTVVIPNPITEVQEDSSVVRSRVVISAGRIAPVKGFDTLIDCWALIGGEFPDWKLLIYGEGDTTYQRKIEKSIEEHGLDDQILLCGITTRLTEIMQKSSLYVMTSLTECFPMVLLEAMSSGLPVVSFDCPNGPRNIVTQAEDGYLVENQDLVALSEKLKLLMSEKSLRDNMAAKGKRNVKRFHLNQIMPMWMDLFDTLKEKHAF